MNNWQFDNVILSIINCPLSIIFHYAPPQYDVVLGGESVGQNGNFFILLEIFAFGVERNVHDVRAAGLNGAFIPSRNSAAAGGHYVRNEQRFIARIFEFEGVFHNGSLSNGAEIVDGFFKNNFGDVQSIEVFIRTDGHSNDVGVAGFSVEFYFLQAVVFWTLILGIAGKKGNYGYWK